MALVAGIDSSTQSCKVVVVDSETGAIVRTGRASHPDGTSVDPQAWWVALLEAAADAGGLDDVEAISVGGQQHGMVALDAEGNVVRDALLWNDTRSCDAAAQLVDELGGAQAWADQIGVVPVASITITKVRWLVDAEPENWQRVAAVCLPHDWLTWKILGAPGLSALVTDRSDASGTGYFDSETNEYRRDLLAVAVRNEGRAESLVLPRVLGPNESAGTATEIAPGALVGPGCGDNAGAALGLGLDVGATSVSLGTSGVVAAVAENQSHDGEGLVAGFADATGHFLPLVCTLNGSRILDNAASLLGVDHAELSRLALSAEPGAGGLTLVPWFEGERTPNLPTATASMSGMTLASMTRENYARASVEGLACLLSVGIAALLEQGVNIDRVSMVGGAAQSEAVQKISAEVFGVQVAVPPSGEYVALGAARQAAWVLSGDELPPRWELAGTTVLNADADQIEKGNQMRERYARVSAEAAQSV